MARLVPLEPNSSQPLICCIACLLKEMAHVQRGATPGLWFLSIAIVKDFHDPRSWFGSGEA
jgi:hypothetical protein